MRDLGYDPESAETVIRLYTILYANETIRWTDHFDSITIDMGAEDVTWIAAPGAQMSVIAAKTDGSVKTCLVQLAATDDGPLDDVDITLGRYDGCPVQIITADTANRNVASLGDVFTGYVGSVTVDVARVISINCRGPLTRLRQDITEKITAMCLADLGDAFDTSIRGHCRAVIMPPDIERSTEYPDDDDILKFVRVPHLVGEDIVYQNLYWECTTGGITSSVTPDYNDKDPGDTVEDGTCIFTARNAWIRDAEVDEATTAMSLTLTESPDPRAETEPVEGMPDWYSLGFLIIRSGRYAGQMVPIRSYDKDLLLVRCWLLVSHMIEPGTKIEISPGCPKTEAGCLNYDQILNRQAFPFAPGKDASVAQA